MVIRYTRQREAILRLLRTTSSHPTANEIYLQVSEEIPNISKGTVYRNLRVLQKIGLISELDLEGTNVSRFDAKQDNHYHFKCEKCGGIFDIDVSVNNKLDQHITLNTGLKVLHHHLEFHGLCHRCQEF
jgi:Fur family transcriptional regulator, peroxide stress response regulator